MFKIIGAIFICCILFSCDIRNQRGRNNSGIPKDTIPSSPPTTVAMIDSTYDFKKVTDGEKVEYNFRFRNTGKNPLVITSATASCGCTVPEKPDAPVLTGETGFLKVVFDSKGRVGAVHKDIYVRSNAVPEFPVLKLVGEVVNKDN